MNKRIFTIFIITLLLTGTYIYYQLTKKNNTSLKQTNYGGPTNESSPLSIEYMRKQEYPGSDIVIEQTLPDGSNYSRYIVSYKSDGLKIFTLLTVPQAVKPKTGWPVIIFNHGYIPPEQYRTTERYITYTDAFSRNGYIVFKSDYQSHGNSEGKLEGAYYSPAYTIDILNAVSSIKKYTVADPNRIGMWGHSMGGTIILRSLVVSKDIKAVDIWAGVVASYEDLTNNWHHPDINPRPLQLQHGTADKEVPLLFSEKLNEALIKANKSVEFYTYEGDDHNLSNNLDLALQRSVEFFDKYLKNGK